MSEETKYLHLLLMIYLFIEAWWCPHFSDGTSVCSVTLASSQLHSPPSQLHSSLHAEGTSMVPSCPEIRMLQGRDSSTMMTSTVIISLYLASKDYVWFSKL